VRAPFAQRALALAGAALLGGVLAVAVSARTSSSGEPGLPEAVGVPGGGWYEALAGVEPQVRERSSCNFLLAAGTMGIAHPVLPCGAQIYVEYRSVRVLTQVVDRGPASPGRDFDLTPALARRLGLHGVRSVRWAYARG
jgi:hypothetical protein